MTPLSSPLATCGILSIGDMGLGITRLLMANNFQVVTNASDRRAKDNSIHLVANDIELCTASDYIFSIVPPAEAKNIAQRISTAAAKNPQSRANPLYFLDLNAISPKSSRSIADTIANSSADIHFIDGGIIGGPPREKDDGTWTRPNIPVSGPQRLQDAQPHGAQLAKVLNIKHINPTIGPASGLKMCFASLTKGFTALAIQSLTTAHNLSVVDELKAQMGDFNPNGLKALESGLPGMCPKAYRWVHEMREIAETFEGEGGFGDEEAVFGAVAGVYRFVSETELAVAGEGRTAEDVARVVSEGTERRKVKME